MGIFNTNKQYFFLLIVLQFFFSRILDSVISKLCLQVWPLLLKLAYLCVKAGFIIAPVAETGLSHRFTAYKIVGHFFELSYRKISGSDQVKNSSFLKRSFVLALVLLANPNKYVYTKNSFFRISNILVPCPDAQLRGRTVIKKLWTIFGSWGRDRFQSPPCWIFWVKLVHPSTTSERTTPRA